MNRTDEIIPIIDPCDTNESKFIFEFLRANPNETYFPTDQAYTFNGRKFRLKNALLQRYRYIYGLPHPQVKYDVLSEKEIAKGATGIVYDVNNTITLGKTSLRVKRDEAHVVKLIFEGELSKVKQIKKCNPLLVLRF